MRLALALAALFSALPLAAQTSVGVDERISGPTTTGGAEAPAADAHSAADFAADGGATMRVVADLLALGHVTRRAVDDAMAREAVEILLRALDPQGLYFSAADHVRLRDASGQIDEALVRGDPSFALELDALHARRQGEACARALAWLAVEHDFSLDEQVELGLSGRGFAATEAELDERWRRQIKYELLCLEAEGLSPERAVAQLRARHLRNANRPREPFAMVGRLLAALAAVYDPHSTYLSRESAEALRVDTRLYYDGVGVVLEERLGRPAIAELLPGCEAALGSLAIGDVVEGLGEGVAGPIEAVEGMTLREVVARLRGPRGSIVRLRVAPADGSASRVVELLRERVELRSSYAAGEVLDCADAPAASRIGWLTLPTFYGDRHGGRSAGRDVAAILDGFRERQVDAVVLDLRGNGGGLLSEAVRVAGAFLPLGHIVRLRGADGRTRAIDDTDPHCAWAGPLVLVVDQHTASASEIVAAALQDHRRALVVGEARTHGKGTVQTVVDLGGFGDGRSGQPLGALKLTIQQFFRPRGPSTQLRGVRADIVLTVAKAREGVEETLPHALPPAVIEPASFVPRGNLGPLRIASLRAASAARHPRAARAAAPQHVERVTLERRAFLAQRAREAAGQVGLVPSWIRDEVCAIARDLAADQ